MVRGGGGLITAAPSWGVGGGVEMSPWGLWGALSIVADKMNELTEHRMAEP